MKTISLNKAVVNFVKGVECRTVFYSVTSRLKEREFGSMSISLSNKKKLQFSKKMQLFIYYFNPMIYETNEIAKSNEVIYSLVNHINKYLKVLQKAL